MELEAENQPPKKSSLERFLNKFSTVEFWNEVEWPIASLILCLRPLHHWLTGQIAKIERGEKVLEIGAGYPLYKLYADKVGENGLFAAVDINPNIQRRAKKICYWLDNILRKEKGESVSVVQAVADATKLPFDDNSFDLVIASNFVGNDFYINEAFRTLKPGGRAIFAWNELVPLVPMETANQATICKELGFEKVKIRPGMPGSIYPGVGWNWYLEARKPREK